MEFRLSDLTFLRILFIIGCTTVTGVFGEWTTISPEDQEWTNGFEEADGNYSLKWNSDDPNWLVVEMSALGKGYVAMGLSPDGGMNNSDIILGWVDADGKPHVKDMFGIGFTKPIADIKQDVELLSGEETEKQTTIKFRRRWNTCDEKQDRRVDQDHIIIWAFNQVDPKLADADGIFRPPYHFTNRGAMKDGTKIELPKGYKREECKLEERVKGRTARSLLSKFKL